jgi:hypothetical protein
MYKQGVGPSPGIKYTGSLILDFQAPEQWEINDTYLQTVNSGYFVIITPKGKITWDTIILHKTQIFPQDRKDWILNSGNKHIKILVISLLKLIRISFHLSVKMKS